ncbi:translation initiation factor IF-2-like [Macaca thibetana thibetana]|uniref:translation initiation factor IF-2-like n=1 Tax=Macaca thibetana thibetana TaxID=257877 RepID=UPI0021BCD086|nr:translation initiation factor IF-2-like [Macaca thibetana thibetana]
MGKICRQGPFPSVAPPAVHTFTLPLPWFSPGHDPPLTHPMALPTGRWVPGPLHGARPGLGRRAADGSGDARASGFPSGASQAAIAREPWGPGPRASPPGARGTQRSHHCFRPNPVLSGNGLLQLQSACRMLSAKLEHKAAHQPSIDLNRQLRR